MIPPAFVLLVIPSAHRAAFFVVPNVSSVDPLCFSAHIPPVGQTNHIQFKMLPNVIFKSNVMHAGISIELL